MDFLRLFLSQPAMLAGLALVGVPIIIHLINRQRFQRRKWAAMVFLLRALKKNQRRIQIENLLLLLLRCAILALLAIAMARPFIRNKVLGNLSSQPENWIFAVDTSYSMEWKSATRSLFETACETIGQMVQNVVKPGDRVAITTLADQPQAVLTPRQVTDSGRNEILRVLESLKTGYGSVDLAASLRKIVEVSGQFEQTAGGAPALAAKRLILFSDFQRRDWLDPGADFTAPRDPSVNDLFREMQQAGIAINRADLKGADRNLTLVDLTLTPSLISQDVWVQFTATVRNYGKEDFDGMELVFHVDGHEERTFVSPIPAGGQLSRSLPYRFSSPGYHSVSAEVRGDSLVVDNRRYLAVEVRSSAEVLLVNGEPGDNPLESETLFLELALFPDESADFRQTPYRPVSRTVEQLLAENVDLRSYAAVIFANVSAGDLPAAFVEDLRKYTANGGALMFFLGKNVVPEQYNQLLHRSADDLLPLAIGDLENRENAPVHLNFADAGHPVARYFLGRRENSYLEDRAIEFKKYFKFQAPPAAPGAAELGADGKKTAAAGPSSLKVMMRFTDDDASPAIFDNGFGQGRVLWMASTADLEWNDLARYPDFIPWLHESLPYLIRFGEGQLNLNIGDTFRQYFEAADFARSISIVPPPASDAAAGPSVPVPKELEKLGEDNRFILIHEETGRPGIYQIRLGGAGGQPESSATPPEAAGAPAGPGERLFAVNLDPEEGDLRGMTGDDLRTHFSEVQGEVFDATRELQEIARQKSAGGGTEFWRHLLWAVAIFLVAETILAHVFGRGLK